MKYLILGHGRHGKDTAAEFLRDKFGVKFKSSSFAAAEIFLFDKLKDEFGYKTIEECYDDRLNNRARWHDEISAYNKPLHRLASNILAENDCYVGMRSDLEVNSCMENGLFDKVFWVDASKRKPKEGKDSFNVKFDPTYMIWIDNNISIEWMNTQLAYHMQMQ